MEPRVCFSKVCELEQIIACCDQAGGHESLYEFVGYVCEAHDPLEDSRRQIARLR